MEKLANHIKKFGQKNIFELLAGSAAVHSKAVKLLLLIHCLLLLPLFVVRSGLKTRPAQPPTADLQFLFFHIHPQMRLIINKFI